MRRTLAILAAVTFCLVAACDTVEAGPDTAGLGLVGTTVPATVQGITAAPASQTSVTVTWQPVPTAVKYRVYVMDNPSMPSRCEPNCTVITPGNQTTPRYVVDGLRSGTTYYVKVSAINAAGKTITGWQAAGVPVSTPTAPVGPNTTDKVLVIVLENHALAQVKKDAPYAYSLGQSFGTATNMVAWGHPSQPNYVVMAAGSNLGVTSNSYKQVSGRSVFGAAIATGRTAKVMAESMGTDRCRQGNYGKYVSKHNPWVVFKDERALCERSNFSYDTYGASDIAQGKLANIEFLIPNQCSNAHDCSLGTFDKWLKVQMGRIFAGPDWKSGRLTVVITADEDDKKNGNVIPLFVVHPSLSHKVVTSKLTMYSINRLLTDFGHVPHMAGGKTAPDMAAAFGLVIN